MWRAACRIFGVATELTADQLPTDTLVYPSLLLQDEGHGHPYVSIRLKGSRSGPQNGGNKEWHSQHIQVIVSRKVPSSSCNCRWQACWHRPGIVRRSEAFAWGRTYPPHFTKVWLRPVLIHRNVNLFFVIQDDSPTLYIWASQGRSVYHNMTIWHPSFPTSSLCWCLREQLYGKTSIARYLARSDKRQSFAGDSLVASVEVSLSSWNIQSCTYILSANFVIWNRDWCLLNRSLTRKNYAIWGHCLFAAYESLNDLIHLAYPG